MNTLRQVAQQALEALEQSETFVPYEGFGMARREAERKHQAAITALKAALAEPCTCGDKPAAQCPGEWEPGCDLGNNPKYAKRVEMTPKELAASIKRGEKWKVAEPGSLMIAAQQFLEWNRAQSPPPVTVGFELGVFEAVKKLYPAPPWRPADPVQEPVAKVDLMTTGGNAGLATRIVEIDNHLRERLRPGQLLYTATPQRKPLTEEDIIDLWAGVSDPESPDISMIDFARAIERAHEICE